MSKEVSTGTGVCRIELELTIESSRGHVWDCLINRPDAWWREDFLAAEGSTFTLEPKVGGLVYEDTGDGTGFVWFQIHGLAPEKQLYLIGHIRPPYGGPCTSMLTLDLEDTGAGHTLLKLSDCVVGRVDQKTADSLDEGWRLLFGGLKEFAEAK